MTPIPYPYRRDDPAFLAGISLGGLPKDPTRWRCSNCNSEFQLEVPSTNCPAMDGLDISFQQALRQSEEPVCVHGKEEPTDPQRQCKYYRPRLSIHSFDSTEHVPGTMLGSWKNNGD